MAWQKLEIEGTPVWWNAETEQMSQTNPEPDTFGGQVVYTPRQIPGIEDQVHTLQEATTIAGYPISAYQQRPKQDGSYGVEVLNPATGQWETGVRMPFEMNGSLPILPASVGTPLGGQPIRTPPPDSWQDKLGSLMPAAIAAFATAGGSLAATGGMDAATAAGDIGGLAYPTGAATNAAQWGTGLGGLGGLTEAELAAAGSGLTEGIEGAAIGAGPVTTTGLSGLGASGVGAAGTAAAGSAAGTATGGILSKIAAGTATADDFLDILGKAAPGLLGAYASNEQTNALTDLANKFGEYGAPSRARYEASMTPGFDPTTIPGYSGALETTSNTLLRQLSAKNGNPFGNPGGLIEANKQIVNGTALPAIQNYQNQNSNSGGLGALASAYPATQTAATTSGANVYNALGSAAGSVLNPPQTGTQQLADLYKLLNTGMKGV